MYYLDHSMVDGVKNILIFLEVGISECDKSHEMSLLFLCYTSLIYSRLIFQNKRDIKIYKMSLSF